MRTVETLTNGWSFRRLYRAGDERGVVDESWEHIALPHTTVELPWHSFDDCEYQQTSIYRQTIEGARREGTRLFIDFEGVMARAVICVDGEEVYEHLGGFTPFSVELTRLIAPDETGELAVIVDGRHDPRFSPFGARMGFLTFAGIYREAHLRSTAPTYITDVFVAPTCALESAALSLRVSLDGGGDLADNLRLRVTLSDIERNDLLYAKELPAAAARDAIVLETPGVALWELVDPRLYRVTVDLLDEIHHLDRYETVVGFRDARFTEGGFALNGRILKLRGLNRHQTFPYIGAAMPWRGQYRDASVLKNTLKCNVVRTSHYPQSRHFLDACDRLGLLVMEEIPGWQHIGDHQWKEHALGDLKAMIMRDRNHPSIVLWGTRINESPDDDEFYARTHALAKKLDPTRQTGGVRNFPQSHLLEDVFTHNDFFWPLQRPNHPLYLNTEFVGHTFPTRIADSSERQEQHALRHADIHNTIGSEPGYAGGIGWAAFDYNQAAEINSVDRVDYHGVCDIFRIPKTAGHFYRSQGDVADEVVIEPGFVWARGDFTESTVAAGSSPPTPTRYVFSNCERLEIFLGQQHHATIFPDRHRFPHIWHPPFAVQLPLDIYERTDLRIDGYAGGVLVGTRKISGDGVDDHLQVEADDEMLDADGVDCTRVTVTVCDKFGNRRAYATGAVTFSLTGPGTLVGDNPFALVGGTGAVWIRGTREPGTLTITATHGRLASANAMIRTCRPPDVADNNTTFVNQGRKS